MNNIKFNYALLRLVYIYMYHIMNIIRTVKLIFVVYLACGDANSLRCTELGKDNYSSLAMSASSAPFVCK